ncbi:hypothetical protein ACFQUU_28240 [Herbaspirillum sp. GCM10030257]|uniref:hypothetical protein n=1 Tax=Herbaspirillum sp. GCM10030257 TaxID=3273393 RepID=UPI00361ADD33
MKLVQQRQPTRLPPALAAVQGNINQQPGVRYHAKRLVLHGEDIMLVFGSRNGIIVDARLADAALVAAIDGAGPPAGAISIDGIEDAASARAVVANFKKILVDPDKRYRMDDTESEQFVDAYRGSVPG